MEGKIVYFEGITRGNPEVTQVTFELVKERLRALDIRKIVLASTTGATAMKALEFFKDVDAKLIVVLTPLTFHHKSSGGSHSAPPTKEVSLSMPHTRKDRCTSVRAAVPMPSTGLNCAIVGWGWSSLAHPVRKSAMGIGSKLAP